MSDTDSHWLADDDEYFDVEDVRNEQINEEFNFGAYDYALHGAERFDNDATLAGNSVHWFPYFRIPVIVFPEQHTPYIFKENQEQQFFKVWNSAKANGFAVNWALDFIYTQEPPFYATVCKVLRANPEHLCAELVGVSRCAVMEINEETGEAKVEILPEYCLPDVLPRFLPRYVKTSGKFTPYMQRELASRISGYPANIIRDLTQKHVNKLLIILGQKLSPERAQAALDKGLTYFSFFVTRNMLCDKMIEYCILRESSADARIAAAIDYCDSMAGLCHRCCNPIFKPDHIFSPNDSSVAHVNAHGFVHKITLLSEIQNFERVSLPSSEFTWFPGYTWIILQCSICHSHIGWEYNSTVHKPERFYGIQREGIRFYRCDSEEFFAKELENDCIIHPDTEE